MTEERAFALFCSKIVSHTVLYNEMNLQRLCTEINMGDQPIIPLSPKILKNPPCPAKPTPNRRASKTACLIYQSYTMSILSNIDWFTRTELTAMNNGCENSSTLDI